MSQKKAQLLNPLNGNLNVTGVVTASSFVGGLTGDVTGDVTGTASTAQGLTGTPNITVGSVTAASGAFSGNVSVGGTLTYQDVEHIDSVGIITAQQGIQVLANGANITGIVTVGVTTIKSGEIEVVGVITATTFKGALTGNVTGNASGTAGGLTGTPDITVNNVVAGVVTATSFEGSGGGLTGLNIPAGFTELDAALFN